MNRSPGSTRRARFEWIYPSACLAFGIALAFTPLDAKAQSAQGQTASEPSAAPSATVAAEQINPATTAPKAVSKPYYIEFRSRSAHSYGHTFSIHGRLNANGRIASKTVSGLHPATESSIPWMIGHFVLVPSETGASDGDTEDQYVTARFQVALSADEYKRVMGFVKDLQAKSPVWHAVLYNCNAFVGDIAKFMGMETPASTMLMPAEYINSLRDLNIAKTGLIGTPVKVASAEQLRAEAMKTLARGNKSRTTVVGAPTPPDSGAQTQNAAVAKPPASRAPAAAAPRAKPAPSASGASSSTTEPSATAPGATAASGSDRLKPESRAPASNKDSEQKRKLTGVAPGNVDRPNLTPSNN